MFTCGVWWYSIEFMYVGRFLLGVGVESARVCLNVATMMYTPDNFVIMGSLTPLMARLSFAVSGKQLAWVWISTENWFYTLMPTLIMIVVGILAFAVFLKCVKQAQAAELAQNASNSNQELETADEKPGGSFRDIFELPFAYWMIFIYAGFTTVAYWNLQSMLVDFFEISFSIGYNTANELASLCPLVGSVTIMITMVICNIMKSYSIGLFANNLLYMMFFG